MSFFYHSNSLYPRLKLVGTRQDSLNWSIPLTPHESAKICSHLAFNHTVKYCCWLCTAKSQLIVKMNVHRANNYDIQGTLWFQFEGGGRTFVGHLHCLHQLLCNGAVWRRHRCGDVTVACSHPICWEVAFISCGRLECVLQHFSQHGAHVWSWRQGVHLLRK